MTPERMAEKQGEARCLTQNGFGGKRKKRRKKQTLLTTSNAGAEGNFNLNISPLARHHLNEYSSYQLQLAELIKHNLKLKQSSPNAYLKIKPI
jgi:hypothetical protein